MSRLALLLGLFVGGLVATVVIVSNLYRREPLEPLWRDWDGRVAAWRDLERVDAV